jgi:hypothetical protein
MIEKQCQFSGEDSGGVYFHLLHPGYNDSISLIKEAQASPAALKQVQKFLKDAQRPKGKVHALISALGAGEFWSSNSNGDHFPGSSLIHTPQGWNELSYKMQKMVGAKWEWGYPTFYNAHAFAHHVNKDPARAFGDVEYSMWDPDMKRVLLVVAVDRARARTLGTDSIIDKIENGEFPSVSMGCRVPFDLCSICTDWDRITGNPKRDLAEHRRNAIRGLSVTTSDYCQHLRFEIGQIYPDGRKVWMWNLHPRFFDISFVFIGADKTSYVLAKLAAGQCPLKDDRPVCPKGCTQCNGHIRSAHVYDVWDREKTAMQRDEDVEAYIKANKKEQAKTLGGHFKRGPVMNRREKTSGYGAFPEYEDYTDPVTENKVNAYFEKKRKQADIVKEAFAINGPRKLAELPLDKQAEIIKRIQSHFSKALPDIEDKEPDIDDDVLDDMSKCPGSLATASGMGIVLKPREFQRVYLGSIGHSDLARDLDSKGVCFRCGAGADSSFRMAPRIIPKIIEALRPMMESRSALWPPLQRRSMTVVITGKQRPEPSDVDHPMLDKMASAYQSYRRQLVYNIADLVPRTLHECPGLYGEIYGDLFSKNDMGLVKTGGNVTELLLGMFPATYLNRVYMPGPVSRYVGSNLSYAGLQRAGALAAGGGVA